MKLTGKPNVGNPHVGFDVAGAGNGPLGTAPALDPTCGSVGVKFPCATRLYTLGKVKVTDRSHNRFRVSSEEKQDYLDNSYPTILNSH